METTARHWGEYYRQKFDAQSILNHTIYRNDLQCSKLDYIWIKKWLQRIGDSTNKDTLTAKNCESHPWIAAAFSGIVLFYSPQTRKYLRCAQRPSCVAAQSRKCLRNLVYTRLNSLGRSRCWKALVLKVARSTNLTGTRFSFVDAHGIVVSYCRDMLFVFIVSDVVHN